MKVLLLAGGWSPEREVSLKGGEQIAAALKERGHSVTLCDPAKDFERLMDMAREHDAGLHQPARRARAKTASYRPSSIA